ncbi:ABC transporter permease [Streptomyces griseiscabiei]|uniref:FtsX-like permease family protein n=1 Tax=Streptomyces griseiscabiei TaxID=2993540 RepID=A0ABU4L5V1_9ACTN|nr:FtsX-like permease family protein [Streptomyces griseiscabiei]MBZ3901690.1 FtsX-like permease family protein [Streptomyces griseiscabiei]MDX2911112.1 FtsX-like permease family protein [Streptomyces griseiscabiei]
MSAVWRAAYAAVRRRRLQSLVIALVTLTSTTAIVVALGLVDAASSPFEKAFGAQRGPHVIAAFDSAKVSDGQLARAVRRSGVAASAGPFAQASVELPREAVDYGLGAELTVVGRAGPEGPVDRLDLWAGRWATGPGEVVLNRQSDWTADDLGKKLQVPSGPALTIVGFAFGLSGTADAWVAPGQIGALKPTSTQMLFRFTDASSESRLRTHLAAVTEELPSGALAGSRSYLALKDQIGGSARAYAPYLLAFGVLGIVVSVLIVANVVSGAVISGFRHIGVLKALGFTPGQVVAVYLVMISVPAVLGCALGTVAGNLAARPLLESVFSGPDAGVFHGSVALAPWVNALALLGMPAVCLLAALAPAVRAHRLSAARAISAGSAPRAGRALGVQRRLAGSRLPRSVSLGLGLPFARPGRSALTLAAVVLGVTTVTFATGLATTMDRFGNAGRDAYQVTVYVGKFKDGKETRPVHDDLALHALLRSLPDAREVTARVNTEARLAGSAEKLWLEARRGDRLRLDSVLTGGRWLRGGGEVVAGSAFLRRNGLDIGDRLRVEKGDRHVNLLVVGEFLQSNPRVVIVDRSAMRSVAPREKPIAYHVRLRDGADANAYARAAGAADPGLSPSPTGSNSVTQTIVGSATALTLLLAAVASLGVFHTAVLNTRDRRRDLGMLKSLGMTPRQVTVMTVVSMALLGALGSLLGIPLGMAGHHLVVPRMADAVDIVLPSSMTDVWNAPALTGLAVAGLVIAVLGAYVPARRAARLTVAEVLHNE